MKKIFICAAIAVVILFVFFDAGARIKAAFMGELTEKQVITIMKSSIKSSDYDDLLDFAKYGTVSDISMQFIFDHETQRLPPVFSTKATEFDLFWEGGPHLFWIYVGQIHLHYDLLRCGRTDLMSKIDHIRWDMLDIATYKNFVLANERDPLTQAIELESAFDFEGRNPIESDPTYTCKQLLRYGASPNPVAPREQWPELRRQMRKETEAKIKRLYAESDKIDAAEKLKKKAATP